MKSGTTAITNCLQLVTDPAISFYEDCPYTAPVPPDSTATQWDKVFAKDPLGEESMRLCRDVWSESLPIDIFKHDCWTRYDVMKRPEAGLILPYLLHCFKDEVLVFVVREPVQWIRSTCNRLQISSLCSSLNTTLGEALAASPSNIYNHQYFLGFSLCQAHMLSAFGMQPCRKADRFIDCLVRQWTYHTLIALHTKSVYNKTIVVHYDAWNHNKLTGSLKLLDAINALTPRTELPLRSTVNISSFNTKWKYVGTDRSQKVEEFLAPACLHYVKENTESLLLKIKHLSL
jgi:hypothetical protein